MSKVLLYKEDFTGAQHIPSTGARWWHAACWEHLLSARPDTPPHSFGEVEGEPEPDMGLLLKEVCTHCGNNLVVISDPPESLNPPVDEKTRIKRRMEELKKVEADLFAREAELDVEMDALIDEVTDLEERLKKLNRPQKKGRAKKQARRR